MAESVSAPLELGTRKIGALLRQFAVPAIIAQTAASLYNMVDSVYIGHIRDVGSYALSGLAISFPLMNLSAALGTLVGVGGMTLISILLGQRNYENANRVLANIFSLNVIIGVLFTLATIFVLDDILIFFGASPQTLPFARDYMIIILLGTVFTHLYFGLNGVIRASGNPRTAMGLTLFTVALNAVLDPLFIFVFDMGIKGAATATILCQVVALTYSIRFFLNKKRVPHFPRPFFQVNWKIAGSSLSIGLAPFMMNAAACIVSIFVNQQLGRYGGDLAIGAYGIVNRFTFVFIMIVMGLNQGMQSIAGYNYGAKLYSRVREVYLKTVKWATLVTTICFLIAEIIPQVACGMFTSDPELLDLASSGMRILNSAMFLVGFGMVTGNFFQCLGKVRIAVFLSLSRQIIFLIPLIYLLPGYMQDRGVWMSFPISDVLSVIVSAIFIVSFFRKYGKIPDGGSE
ncbi:MAG: MATE family efflux transporter [Bacteroidales bacterium]|nr:MATE family efflux transporter [Bacteroidales bacterium]